MLIEQNSTSIKQLKIISINVNSIIQNQRRANLLELLRKEIPDIVLLGETKISDRHKIEFKDYAMERRDRPNSNQGGGTAILIKKPLKYNLVITPESVAATNLEVTIIYFNLPQNKKLYIISAYAKCGNQKEFNVELQQLFESLKLNNINNYYVLAGDLNAKHTNWLNESNNQRGLFLQNWLINNFAEFRAKLYSSEQPSFPKAGSYLDLGIIDCRLRVETVDIDKMRLPTHAYDSDHHALEIIVAIPNICMILETQEESHRLNFKGTDWNKFKSHLYEKHNLFIPNDINLNNNEIDTFLNSLEALISTAISKIVPKIKSRDLTDSYSNSTIRRLQREKSHLLTKINNIYRKFQHRDNEELVNLKNQLKITKKFLKLEYSQSVNNYWKDKIENIPINDPKNMFPQINQIFRAKGKITIPNLKVPETARDIIIKAKLDEKKLQKDKTGQIIVTELKDKLHVIGSHFEKIHIQNSGLGKERLNAIVNKEIDKLKLEILNDHTNNITVTHFSVDNPSDNPTDGIDYLTSFSNLAKIFKKLNSKKSSGLDNIPNIALKHLPNKIIRQYCILFNNALNNMYFPSNWKIAKTIALKKPGKLESDPSSYRPISLLPNISKVLEVVINRSLVHFCNINDIIPNSQFGFRFKHSTIHAINKFSSDVCWALNNNECVAACLIDLEKAFDTVWVNGLIYKLIKKKFPLHLVKMIFSSITNKQFFTSTGADISDIKFSVKEGLQQGTVNSPILFNIFNSDILRLYEFNDKPNKSALAFADDIVIYHKSNNLTELQKDLQKSFENVRYYCDSWKMKINPGKCETILFRPQLSHASRSIRSNYKNFKIKENENNDTFINHKTIVKYLGINIDDKLKYTQHLTIQLQKAMAAWLKLKRLFYNKYLHPKIKINCYQLLIRPILTYGSPIWYNISASNMEKIRVFERKCLRACLGLNRTRESNHKRYISNTIIYNKANIQRIDSHILGLTRGHFANVAKVKHNSLIFASLYPQDMYYQRAMKTGFVPPEAFLYLDKKGYIKDNNNIPIIYHVHRISGVNTIKYPAALDSNVPYDKWRFDKTLPTRDKIDKSNKDTKRFWWLE